MFVGNDNSIDLISVWLCNDKYGVEWSEYGGYNKLLLVISIDTAGYGVMSNEKLDIGCL